MHPLQRSGNPIHYKASDQSQHKILYRTYQRSAKKLKYILLFQKMIQRRKIVTQRVDALPIEYLTYP